MILFFSLLISINLYDLQWSKLLIPSRWKICFYDHLGLTDKILLILTKGVLFI